MMWTAETTWTSGLSVAAARRFSKFYVYLGLGHAWFGRDNFRGLEIEDKQFSFLGVGEYRFGARMSLLLQYQLTEGLEPENKNKKQTDDGQGDPGNA